MAEQKSPTPAEITIMAAGAVALVGSFLKFFGSDDFGSSAWASGNFPLATLMAIFVAVMGAQVALDRLAGVDLPTVPGFSWVQTHLVLGFFATLYALAFLVVETGGAERKIGFWLILIGSVGGFVGAILLSKERSGPPAPPMA